MAFDRSKFIARFLEEAREHIGKLNDGLLHLEKNPGDVETLNAIVRAAHTVKGGARMLKLTGITTTAHKLEDALDALRAGRLKQSRQGFDLLFKGIEAITNLVEGTAGGGEPEADEALLDKLSKAAEGRLEDGVAVSAPPPAVEDKTPEPAQPPAASERAAAQAPSPKAAPPPAADVRKPAAPTAGRETIRVNAERVDALIKHVGEMMSVHSRSKQRWLDVRGIEKISAGNLQTVGRFLTSGSTEPASMSEALQAVERLHAEILRLSRGIRDDMSLQDLQMDELRERTLRMRMLPLSTVFGSFALTVRNIASSMGKEIELIVEGGDTELDKKIIEKLSDPLIHMIRNSIDHGIETPEERVKAGKPPTGTIRLSAGHDEGGVLIVVSDDGGGIPLGKIREKALKKKMFDEETLDGMSETEILNLIFHHGFSTSPIITDMSGRGVGMEVVKKSIVEELKGSLNLESTEGRGAAFQIRLPLSLAIMHVMLVSVSEMTFALPADSVVEVLEVSDGEMINIVDRRAIRLREQLIPVENLGALLKLPSGPEAQGNGSNGGRRLVVIISEGGENLGLIIEALLDEQDMVTKPLPSHMKKIRMVSGVAISGKNEIINILHMPSLVQAAKEAKGTAKKKAGEGLKKSMSVLVVDDSVNTREIEKEILEAYGYTVTLACDGMEALEMTRESKYDVIISDVEMPRMDGFTLVETLRKEKDYQDTPIIIVSSRDKESDKRRGIEVGADAYIIKGGFDQSNLLETIESLTV